MRLEFHTLDVFTDRPFGGNPLAVFPDAAALDPRWMQPIAHELNLSETVFVLPAEKDGTCRLRIFTPRHELPFAGHPTAGSAILLALLGRVEAAGGVARMVLEEGAGDIDATVRLDPGGAPAHCRFTVPAPATYGAEPPPAAVLAPMLGLAESDLSPRPPVTIGVPIGFTVIHLASRDALTRARLDTADWERLLAGGGAPLVYVVSSEVDPARDGQDADYAVRMFAPGEGIPEDPATGSAASAYARYLADRSDVDTGTLRWVLAQGADMGRPGRIEIEADRKEGATASVRVGGTAVPMSRGELTVPD